MSSSSKSVLQEGVHDRLIADIDYIAAQSKVPVSMIKKSSEKVLTPMMKQYLKGFRLMRKEGRGNVWFEAPMKVSPEKAMMGMAAVLIRNFIDARVYPLQTILDADMDVAAPTVLMVPNFQNSFIGKPLASHQIQKLYSVLLDRMVNDKVTIVYVENMTQLKTQYGNSVGEFIESNYTKLKE